jgi:hypothetical protein
MFPMRRRSRAKGRAALEAGQRFDLDFFTVCRPAFCRRYPIAVTLRHNSPQLRLLDGVRSAYARYG